VPGPAIVVKLLAAGAMTVVAALTMRADHRRRVALLRALVERRGGTLNTASAIWTLELQDGIRLEISFYTSKHSNETIYWVHVPPPGTAWFKIGSAALTDFVGKLFGADDIELGDPAFDDKYVVKARDPAAVRRMWTRERMRELERHFATARIESDGMVVNLREPAHARTVDALEQGIDFLLRLVSSDPFGLNALSALPEAVMRQGDRFAYAELPGPQPILVGPHEIDQVARTSAWTAAVGDPKAELPPGAEELLIAIGTGTLRRTDHEVRVMWPTIETDQRRLVSAIELLRMLATGPRLGVFR
jgi:hypothetical protein